MIRSPCKMKYLAPLLLLILILSGCRREAESPNLTETTDNKGRVPVTLVKVHDGDTVSLLVEGSTHRTRLIGIDCPEFGQKRWGRCAMKHMETLLSEGDGTLWMETDVQIRDKYHRLLVYLWDGRGVFINRRMVRDGYAVLLTIPPNVAYTEELKAAEREARREGRGIWGEDGLEESPSRYREKHPRR